MSHLPTLDRMKKLDIKDLAVALASILYMLVHALILYGSISDSVVVPVISFSLVGMYYFRVFSYFSQRKLKKILIHSFLTGEVILIITLYNVLPSMPIQITYQLFVTSIILTCPLSYGVFYAYLGFIPYIVGIYMKMAASGTGVSITQFLAIPFAYSTFVLLMVVAKTMIQRNDAISRVNKELESKNKLIEEITLLEERNRMSGEMHDTVGHTITKAIVQIEAAKALVKVDQEQAFLKMEAASYQAKQSLDELRSTVRKLKRKDEGRNLKQRLDHLIGNTITSTGIEVDFNYQPLVPLNPEQEQIIFNAVMESLTNAIKYSACTRVTITIKCDGSNCLVKVTDNGIGCDNIEPGFGITNINNHVRKMGGSMKVGSVNGEGFFVDISIPAK